MSEQVGNVTIPGGDFELLSILGTAHDGYYPQGHLKRARADRHRT